LRSPGSAITIMIPTRNGPKISANPSARSIINSLRGPPRLSHERYTTCDPISCVYVMCHTCVFALRLAPTPVASVQRKRNLPPVERRRSPVGGIERAETSSCAETNVTQFEVELHTVSVCQIGSRRRNKRCAVPLSPPFLARAHAQTWSCIRLFIVYYQDKLGGRTRRERTVASGKSLH